LDDRKGILPTDSCASYLQWFSVVRNAERNLGELVNPGSSGKWLLKQMCVIVYGDSAVIKVINIVT